MSNRDFGLILRLPSGRYQVRYRTEGVRTAAPMTLRHELTRARTSAQSPLTSCGERGRPQVVQRRSWVTMAKDGSQKGTV